MYQIMFTLNWRLSIFAMIITMILCGCQAAQNRGKEAGYATKGMQSNFSLSKIVGSLDDERYFIATSCAWVQGSTHFCAVIEAHKITAGIREPSSRLTIRNLTSDKIIYQKDLDGSPGSMSVAYLTPDGIPKLYLNHYTAASASNVYIFSVSDSNTHLILDKNYSGEEQPILLYEPSTDSVDILLSDRGLGLEPTKLSRYRWQNGQYSLLGTVPYENLHRLINNYFANKGFTDQNK
jgi:hypothetical protein